jgi:hypothetical protein
MKTPMLSLLVGALLLPQLLAENSPPVPRLAGIINLPDQRLVLLGFSQSRSTPPSLILRESEREGEIEVIRISAESGAVELRIGRTNSQLTVRPSGEGSHTPISVGGLVLVKADIDFVLRLYGEFKGRTVLRSPRLPAVSLSLETAVTNQAGAAQVLEKALAAKAITTIPDGDKFVMVVPNSEIATVKPRSAEIRSSTRGRSELMPVGAISFSNADLNQASAIYANLIGRKLDQTQPTPQPTLAIKFRNQTPLTKEECVYALDTLFRWQNVKVVPIGEGLVKVVPIPKSEQ